MSRTVRFAPLAVLALIIAALIWRLAAPADRDVRSSLEGKALPAFALAQMLPDKPPLAATDFKTGEPQLLNIFASWCVPCASEVKVLRQLQRQGVRVEGIAIRDKPDDLAGFLARNGDPYERIGGDPQSAVQISLGSSGVPETFVVDGKGIIRGQHIGPIEQSDVPDIMRQLERAR